MKRVSKWATVWLRLRRSLPDEGGGVLALVALFLPIAILCAGMVEDLGAVFVARKAVQAACDLGSLAGVLELDWDRLAEGEVRLREQDGEGVATEVASDNLDSLTNLINVISLTSTVQNPPARPDPVVIVEVRFTVRTPSLRWLPGLSSGFQGTIVSEASVVQRTRW